MSFLKSAAESRVYAEFPTSLHPFLGNVFREGKYGTKKILNFTLNRLERRLRKSHLLSYPYSLVVDPTNICNLRCPLCPTWQDPGARAKGKIDLRTFSALLDEVGPYLFIVNLCNWGEPLLNPELPSVIRYAKKFNTVAGLSTNLNHLPDEMARELVQSGIDVIVVSIDGATQESYSKYRAGGNIETVFGNIKKLTSLRQTTRKFPLLVWQFLVNRYNEPELEKAREMAREMGLRFLPSPMRTSMGKELLLPLYERVGEMKDWLPKDPEYNKYAYEIRPGTRTGQAECKWLWSSSVVNWDGSVSPCCGVFEKMWDFGTYTGDAGRGRRTFHRAWNSPRYQLARRLVAAYMRKARDLDALLETAEKEGLICSRCVRFGFLED